MDKDMRMREWHGGDAPLHYLYSNDIGRIIGETALVGHARRGMHSCTVYPNPQESISLGVFISCEASKNRIEAYWKEYDDTFDCTPLMLGS